MRRGIKNREYKKRGKMHYNTKKYSNPFFQDKKRAVELRNTVSAKAKFFMLLLFFLSAISIWFLFYSDYFNIKDIEITGEGSIPYKNIRQITESTTNSNIFVLLPKNNLILFDNNKLSRNLKEDYYFDYLVIEKDYPSKIKINYKEKEYSAIWSEDSEFYFIDDFGKIITKASSTDTQKQYPVIKNNTEFKIINKKIGLNPTYVTSSIALSKILDIYTEELQIKRYVLESDGFNSIKVILESGPYLLFDISKDLQHQVDKLMIVKNERIKEDFINKEYIDLRTGDQVNFR